MTDRSAQYKNEGKDVASQRKNRIEDALSLRKVKREENLAKRRNIPQESESKEQDDFTLEPLSLEEVVVKARSSDPDTRLHAVTQARKFLSSERNPPINELIDRGILPILVDGLHSNDETLQFEAAWALTNIASGTSEQTHAVVSAGAVPYFLNLLSSQNMNVCEQAIWALGNIVGDGPHYRDFCIELGILDPLVKFVHPTTPVKFLRNVTWVLVNLCRNNGPSPPLEVYQMVLSAFSQLIHREDVSILLDTMWALTYITEAGHDYIQMVIDSGILKFAIPLLAHNDVKVVTPTLRCVGNIVTGSDEQTQAILNFGALNYIPFLLGYAKAKINKEAVWFLSNIAAGTQNQIQAIVDAKLLPRVFELLDRGDFPTQKEAVWTVSNIAWNGAPSQLWYMVENGVLEPMCKILRVDDTQTVHVALEGLFNILKKLPEHYSHVAQKIEECGGMEQIEHLQNHKNEELYKLAYSVIDEFFSEHEDGKLDENSGFKFEKSQEPFNQYQF